MSTETIMAHVDYHGQGARNDIEVRAALIALIPELHTDLAGITPAEDGAWEIHVPASYTDSVREHGYPVELGDAEGNAVNQTDDDVNRVLEEDTQ